LEKISHRGAQKLLNLNGGKYNIHVVIYEYNRGYYVQVELTELQDFLRIEVIKSHLYAQFKNILSGWQTKYVHTDFGLRKVTIK